MIITALKKSNIVCLCMITACMVTPVTVCASAYVGETVILDGGSASGASYGSESGYSERESGSGGSGTSGGRSSYVRPDNENERLFRQSQTDLQAIVQSLLGRARAANGANVSYGDLMKNGSACTVGLVQPTEDEFLRLIGNAQSIFENTTMFDPGIINRYEGMLGQGGYADMPSNMASGISFSDGFYEDGEGADIDSSGNTVDGNGRQRQDGQTALPGSQQGAMQQQQDGSVYYPGATDAGIDASFFDLGSFFQNYNIGADMSEFMNKFYEDAGLRLGQNASGAYTLPSLWNVRQLFLSQGEDGKMHLGKTYGWDDSGNSHNGIRSDLINGGLNIADNWLDRFRGLSRYTSNSSTNVPTFALMTEYRVSDVRVNDRTDIQFIPDTRYWSIDKPDGSTMTVKTEDPYLVFTPQEKGVYKFRSSQEAIYTVRTSMTVIKSEYLFDTNTGSILYFKESAMAPYYIGATQQRKYIPTRGYTVTVNDLGEFETTEDDNRGIIERVE